MSSGFQANPKRSIEQTFPAEKMRKESTYSLDMLQVGAIIAETLTTYFRQDVWASLQSRAQRAQKFFDYFVIPDTPGSFVPPRECWCNVSQISGYYRSAQTDRGPVISYPVHRSTSIAVAVLGTNRNLVMESSSLLLQKIAEFVASPLLEALIGSAFNLLLERCVTKLSHKRKKRKFCRKKRISRKSSQATQLPGVSEITQFQNKKTRKNIRCFFSNAAQSESYRCKTSRESDSSRVCAFLRSIPSEIL